MTSIHFDTTEVNRLAVDFSKAPGRIQRKAPRIMQKTAFDIKTRMRRDARGHRYLPHFAREINYDRTDTLGLAYEIGFDKQEQGNLANIIVFGSINNAPVYDFYGALYAEALGLVNKLAAAGQESVLGVGA